MVKALLVALILLPVWASAGGFKDHFSVADQAAEAEGAPWIESYRRAVSAFGSKKSAPDAIAEFNYLAFDGSVASAIRLCAIYAHGVKSEVNPIAGLFWCGKAYDAGYKDAGRVRHSLFIKYWPEYEE